MREIKDLDKSFERVFVTGDIHGEIIDLEDRVESMMATKNDLLILLDDCGFYYDSYFADEGKIASTDYDKLVRASKLPCTILCVQGNHEQPFKEMSAKRVKIFDGEGYCREGVYFAENGTEFHINGKSFLVVGGACSVDRNVRFTYREPWFENEELTQSEFDEIIKKTMGKSYDFVLTHTVPYEDIPKEALLSGGNLYTNDNHTERNLQTIKENISFGKWYAGHFHINKYDEKLHILFEDYEQII